jgi:chromosomal replication initiator protein
VKAQDAWEMAYSQLELQLDRGSFDTWLRGAVFLGVEGAVFVVGVRSAYARDMLQHRLYRNVWRILSDVWDEPVEIRFEVHRPVKDEPPQAASLPLFRLLAEQQQSVQTQQALFDDAPSVPVQRADENGGSLSDYVKRPQQPALPESELDPRMRFERFVVSNSNRMAFEAARAVADKPGRNYNPFFIYGGVGLGKTHLVQAIGNHARSQGLVDTCLYVSSERFTSEFVHAIQHNRVAEFSMFYRQIDLLIVDDVQFFSGKEKTQEEFFHIFNTLHQSGKQIVLCSDRPPRDIQGIEERLLSRFQWGLSADVQPPELETRIAILQRKAEDDGIEIDQDVIEFIAHNVKSNIRELEGALIRLLAHSTLHRREIDLVLAKEVLRDLIKETRANLTIDDIQRIVCEYFKISPDLVRAKTRKREIVQARQAAMYFCKQLTQHSLKTIGLHFGGRDHSTVIHACQTVNDQMDTDSHVRETINDLRHLIDLRSR